LWPANYRDETLPTIGKSEGDSEDGDPPAAWIRLREQGWGMNSYSRSDCDVYR
jgi:hypothetical protein